MPINSNGSSLKVTTNMGGRLLEDEEYFYDTYKDNKPKATKTQRQMQAPVPQMVQVEEKSPDAPVDDKLASAIDNDLKKRGIKKRTKKTTTD